jgi:hypothetical protein
VVGQLPWMKLETSDSHWQICHSELLYPSETALLFAVLLLCSAEQVHA